MAHSEVATTTPEALAQQLAGLAGGDVSFYAATANAHANTTLFICEFGPPSDTPVELPALAKWLRVNERPLPRPDSNQVIEDLPATEQAWLDRTGVRLCVPLVLEGELLGIGCLHQRPEARAPSESLLRGVHQWARGAAIAWRQMREHQDQQRETAAAYRSQQLTTTGQLAASVAHEVRNPLAAVRSIVQLVRDTTPTAERRVQLLGDVLVEVDRIDHTVSGLLGLARPHEAVVTTSNLGDMTADAVRFMETLARRSGIQLDLKLETRVTVQMDPREFRQVLLNVLLNACEACQSGDAITVTVGRSTVGSGATAAVRVRDTGAGIPPEVMARIFDSFFTTKSAGSGLGLAVSRDLLRRHGGDIRAENDGTGTLVILELPVIESR